MHNFAKMKHTSKAVFFVFLLSFLIHSSIDAKLKRDLKGKPKVNRSTGRIKGSGDGKRNLHGGEGFCRQSCCGCGVAGPPGIAGTQGIQGVQGVQGPAGQPGLPGARGSKGEKGDRGFKGEGGIPGKTLFRPQPERPQVAFSVTMDEDMPRSPKYRVVKFSKILSNIGGAYDPENGIFTTPINGTYVIGFTGVSYHGQDMLLHLIKNGQRKLSAFDNSGCGCCNATNGKCAGSGSNMGILTLMDGDQIWIELPDEHGIHNAPYHNYASFYGYLLYPKSFGFHYTQSYPRHLK